jgi:hypothetical protein
VQLVVVNQTKQMSGAHATTMLVNDFVNARLGSYGPGVEEVWVTLLYPPKSRPGPAADPFGAEFLRLLKRSPRVTFFRAKRRIEVLAVCRGVSPRSMVGDGHLTPDEAERLVAAVAEAVELIRPRVRPTDRFDCDAFIADARKALARCPRAIRRWLS